MRYPCVSATHLIETHIPLKSRLDEELLRSNFGRRSSTDLCLNNYMYFVTLIDKSMVKPIEFIKMGYNKSIAANINLKKHNRMRRNDGKGLFKATVIVGLRYPPF